MLQRTENSLMPFLRNARSRDRRDTPYSQQKRLKKAANELGYPVLVRPSYVLGGQGMRIAVSDEDVEEYIGIINQIAQEHPILVDKY